MPNPKRPPKPMRARPSDITHETLTRREHDVAHLVIQGSSNKRIAAHLEISEHTAKFHVNNFIAKMGAHTRVDAAVKYARWLDAETAVHAAALEPAAA